MIERTKKTYLFIPGGWHGAWVFDPITTRMKSYEKDCFSLTLPGLEQKTVRQHKIINLTTHIQFVIDFIIEKKLTNVILCGHSYAGMVITGVADIIPENIFGLVYIDAYIPKDGDSCWKLTSDQYRELFAAGAAADGFNVVSRPGSDSRRRPHPLATFMQSLRLIGNYKQIRNLTFIYLSGWENTPFRQPYELHKNSPEWRVEVIDCEHNVMEHRPDELTEILLSIDK